MNTGRFFFIKAVLANGGLRREALSGGSRLSRVENRSRYPIVAFRDERHGGDCREDEATEAVSDKCGLRHTPDALSGDQWLVRN